MRASQPFVLQRITFVEPFYLYIFVCITKNNLCRTILFIYFYKWLIRTKQNTTKYHNTSPSPTHNSSLFGQTQTAESGITKHRTLEGGSGEGGRCWTPLRRLALPGVGILGLGGLAVGGLLVGGPVVCGAHRWVPPGSAF